MITNKQNNIKETRIYELRPVRVSSAKEHGFDAYLIQGGIGNWEGGYIYDFKTGKSYYSFGGNASKGILPIGAEVAGLRLVSFDQSFNLKRPDNREDIFSGRSIGGNVYIGFGVGGIPLTKGAQYCHAILTGQVQIQQNQIIPLCAKKLQCLISIVTVIHAVCQTPQTADDCLAQDALIFNDQKVHKNPPILIAIVFP